MAFAGMIACGVRYRNTTTEVEISYTWYEDLSGTPQVICGRLKVNDEGSLEVEEAYVPSVVEFHRPSTLRLQRGVG